MKKRERRSFDKNFKLMVMELHKGKSSREIGREQGLLSDMVRRWSRENSAGGEASIAGNGIAILTAEQKEITQ